MPREAGSLPLSPAGRVAHSAPTHPRRALVEACEARRLFAAVSWTGNAGDNLWGSASNWSTGSVPSGGDDVSIGAVSAITLTNSLRQVQSLTTAANIRLSGGAVLIVGSGGVTLNSANLSVGGDVARNAASLWFAGSDVAGGIRVNGTGELQLGASDRNRVLNVLFRSTSNTDNLAQTVTVASGVTLRAAGGAFYDFDAQEALPASTRSFRLEGPTFAANLGFYLPTENAGAMSVSLGGSLAFYAPFDNTGTIQATRASLVLPGRGTGSVTVADSTTTFYDTFTQADVAGLTRSGGLVRITGTVNGNVALTTATGNWQLLSGATFAGGTYTSTGAGKLIVDRASFNGVTLASDLDLTAINGATVTVLNSLTLANGAHVLIGSTDGSVSAGLDVVGTDVTGGISITGTGSVVLGSSASNHISNQLIRSSSNSDPLGLALTFGAGVDVKGSRGTFQATDTNPNSFDPRSFRFFGSLTQADAGGSLRFLIPVDASGAIASTGVIDFEAGLAAYDAASGTLGGNAYSTVGAGKIVIVGASVTRLSASVTFSGPSSGIFADTLFSTSVFAGALTIAPAGSLSLADGADLAAASLRNEGLLSLSAGSTLTLAGDFTNAEGASLNVTIAGGAEANIGRLAAGGVATLGGTLNATFANGYQPTATSSLEIIRAQTRTGRFLSSTVGNSNVLSVAYLANGVRLVGSSALPLTTPVLSADSDTGASNADGYTAATALVFSGKAIAGANVTLLANGAQVGSAVANDNGDYAVTVTSLGDGVYQITAAIGADSVSSASTLTVDRTAPIIPAHGPLFIAVTPGQQANAMFDVSATDNLDPAPVVTSSPASGSAFDRGLTPVTLTAVDLAGNTTTQTFNVLVFEPSLTLDTASDTGASSSDNYTADNTPTVTGQAPIGSSVTIFDAGVSVGSGVAGADGIFSITLAPLGDGLHSLTALTDSGTFGELKITVDTAAPVISGPGTVTATATNASGASVSFAATASDSLDVQPTLSYSVASGSTFAIGTSTATVTATDLAGNTATQSFGIVVSPPVITPTIGGIDPNYGLGTGVTVIVVPQANLVALDSVLLSSGKVLSSGIDAAHNQLVLTRINLDGSIDPTFATRGIFRVDIPNDFTARRVQMDAAGNSYVLGFVSATGQPAAIRYTSDGVLDIGLANGGLLIIAPFVPGDTVDSIVIAPKGGFLVGGSKVVNGISNAALALVTATGAVDRKFAKGLYLRPGGSLDTFTSIAVGPKNLVYATGVTGSAGGSALLTMRFSAAGKADAKFTLVTAMSGYALAAGQKLIVQADGKVLVSAVVATSAGEARAGRFGLAALRYTAKGLLDPSFSGGGVTITATPPDAPASSAAVDRLAAASSGVTPMTVADLVEEFDRATASISTIPGGKIRQLSAQQQGEDTLLILRQIIADSVNLAALSVSLKAAKPYKPGAPVRTTVRVSNIGTLTTPATVPVTLYLSADTVLDAGDLALTPTTAKLKLKPGASKTLKATALAPTQSGNYFVIAVVNAGPGAFADLTPTNDAATANQPFIVVGTTVVQKSFQGFDDAGDDSVLKRLFSNIRI